MKQLVTMKQLNENRVWFYSHSESQLCFLGKIISTVSLDVLCYVDKMNIDEMIEIDEKLIKMGIS